MAGDDTVTREPKKGGRAHELSVQDRNAMRRLRSKGQSYEELAVGFGVSYNTVRSISNSPEEDEAAQQPTPSGPTTPPQTEHLQEAI